MVLGVQVHPLRVIHTRDLLVGVDGCQDAADISLKQSSSDTSESVSVSFPFGLFSFCLFASFFLYFSFVVLFTHCTHNN